MQSCLLWSHFSQSDHARVLPSFVGYTLRLEIVSILHCSVMARIVRSSKFRHVFGTPAKSDLCYNNVKITKIPWESNMCAVNSKFVAVVLESQGGGAFMVIPVEKVRVPIQLAQLPMYCVDRLVDWTSTIRRCVGTRIM